MAPKTKSSNAKILLSLHIFMRWCLFWKVHYVCLLFFFLFFLNKRKDCCYCHHFQYESIPTICVIRTRFPPHKPNLCCNTNIFSFVEFFFLSKTSRTCSTIWQRIFSMAYLCIVPIKYTNGHSTCVQVHWKLYSLNYKCQKHFCFSPHEFMWLILLCWLWFTCHLQLRIDFHCLHLRSIHFYLTTKKKPIANERPNTNEKKNANIILCCCRWE